MAQPATLLSTYKGGMKRDGAREALPQGALWNLVDFIPESLGALCRKRGGWEIASQNFELVVAGGGAIVAGIVAEFTAGQSVLTQQVNTGRWWEVESAAASENIGTCNDTRNPVFFTDKVIVPDMGGTVAPSKITRTGATHAIATLGGSPPAGRYALVYKDVLWLGGNAALPKRTYFCVIGNPESWDTAVKWADMSYPVTGYGALSNAVLVFSLQRTSRVRGSIPPPGGDFTIDDPVFEVGCTDNRSIVNYRDKVIFANAQGLYMTDGVALEDLTRVCGMKNWWRDIMAGRSGFSTGAPYSVTSHTISAGIFDDFYIYSIMNGTTLVDAGMIDLTRYNWMRISNLKTMMFFDRLYPQELFWGHRSSAYVCTITDLLNPTAANEVDADGAAVLPYLETAFFGAQPGLKTFQTAFVTYDISGGSSPVLRVSAADTPEGLTYTDLVPDLAAQGHIRRHLEINRPGYGISFKVQQIGQSTDTRLHEIEMAAGPRERSR